MLVDTVDRMVHSKMALNKMDFCDEDHIKTKGEGETWPGANTKMDLLKLFEGFPDKFTSHLFQQVLGDQGDSDEFLRRNPIRGVI